jgi:hypothetical protein
MSGWYSGPRGGHHGFGSSSSRGGTAAWPGGRGGQPVGRGSQPAGRGAEMAYASKKMVRIGDTMFEKQGSNLVACCKTGFQQGGAAHPAAVPSFASSSSHAGNVTSAPPKSHRQTLFTSKKLTNACPSTTSSSSHGARTNNIGASVSSNFSSSPSSSSLLSSSSSAAPTTTPRPQTKDNTPSSRSMTTASHAQNFSTTAGNSEQAHSSPQAATSSSNTPPSQPNNSVLSSLGGSTSSRTVTFRAPISKSPKNRNIDSGKTGGAGVSSSRVSFYKSKSLIFTKKNTDAATTASVKSQSASSPGQTAAVTARGLSSSSSPASASSMSSKKSSPSTKKLDITALKRKTKLFESKKMVREGDCMVSKTSKSFRRTHVDAPARDSDSVTAKKTSTTARSDGAILYGKNKWTNPSHAHQSSMTSSSGRSPRALNSVRSSSGGAYSAGARGYSAVSRGSKSWGMYMSSSHRHDGQRYSAFTTARGHYADRSRGACRSMVLFRHVQMAKRGMRGGGHAHMRGRNYMMTSGDRYASYGQTWYDDGWGYGGGVDRHNNRGNNAYRYASGRSDSYWQGGYSHGSSHRAYLGEKYMAGKGTRKTSGSIFKFKPGNGSKKYVRKSADVLPANLLAPKTWVVDIEGMWSILKCIYACRHVCICTSLYAYIHFLATWAITTDVHCMPVCL